MKLRVNGVERSVDPDWQNENLLVVLREQLGLTGSRYGCGIGQCGACVVHLDGAPVASCMVPVGQAADKDVLTIEGLAAADGSLHPLQQAWIDANVPQCGYCQSGQIMQALALVQQNSEPTDPDIDQAMSGNLCRCGTYDRIRIAIKRGASVMRETR
jgi:isoquinoline 1-oxidoreductase alpha subunit